MSDDSNPHGTPSTSPAPPPPPASSTLPPVPGQPPLPSDTTGGVAATTASRGGLNISISVELVFGLLGLIGIVLAVLLKESPGQGAPGENYWDNAGVLWSLAAIAAAVLALVPALNSFLNLDQKLAWRLGAAGAAFLVFWWVLFVLPTIGIGSTVKNLPFVATVAIALSVLAVWTSAGNPYNVDRSASSS